MEQTLFRIGTKAGFQVAMAMSPTKRTLELYQQKSKTTADLVSQLTLPRQITAMA